MFQYEFEKRPPSPPPPPSTTWAPPQYARRPLPPRPGDVRMPIVPAKTSVPLKVWVIAGASCFAVCAVLVLATIALTRWGSVAYGADVYERPEPIYARNYPELKAVNTQTTPTPVKSQDVHDEIQILSRFKNVVANRDRNKNIGNTLLSKPQIYPIEDQSVEHAERNIEKKDQARYDEEIFNGIESRQKSIPEFRPTLPDIFVNSNRHILLPDGYTTGVIKTDEEYVEEYYNDQNLYEDYLQSNTMTSYLIEKIQELYEWVTTDPDFTYVRNSTQNYNASNDFGQLLKALNQSLFEGNISIIMNKLKDLYFNTNLTANSIKAMGSNSTDLFSFGILTLDVMLLHNIQIMAWENQEAVKVKMLQDPDVFAFNALFMEPNKIEAKRNEIKQFYEKPTLRRTSRLETAEDFDFGKNLLDNILEIGMSTARAAIHLGRAYKNTKNVLNQISNRENSNSNHISRDVDGSAHALGHLQTSFDSSRGVANLTGRLYTDLDCIWLVYCRNLAATSKLNAPYGTMARINGFALRLVRGEAGAGGSVRVVVGAAGGAAGGDAGGGAAAGGAAGGAGWGGSLHDVLASDLHCDNMFPRCSKVNAAAVVLDSIRQPLSKSNNRAR